MKSIIFLLGLFLAQNCLCQEPPAEDEIRQNAISIGNFDTVDTRIADIFKTQKLILVGEMQGTAEPAEFVHFLVKNLIGKGRKIYVGLEISAWKMPDKELYDSAALSQSYFFKDEQENAGSKAWLNLITNTAGIQDVDLFFFGLTQKQTATSLHHADSLMYMHIRAKMLSDTNALYICLTGSFHNKLTGHQFPEPMGNYFLTDKALHLTLYNMVSFCHKYVEGAAYFNTGDGARLHTLNATDYFYTITGMRNYFSFTHDLIGSDYNGILFTYKVTASFGLH